MTDTKLWEIDQPPVVVLAGEGRPALEDELRERTPYRIEAIGETADVAEPARSDSKSVADSAMRPR